MTRTPQEIKDRINAIESEDWMGTQRSGLIDYLPFADAKEFLKPECAEEMWLARDRKSPLDAIAGYLPFAWEKANDCRGLSAGRSIDHIKAWLWLAGLDALTDEHFNGYSYYGKPQLAIASALCSFEFLAHDNGEWVNEENGPSLSGDRIGKFSEDARAIAANAKASHPELFAA